MGTVIPLGNASRRTRHFAVVTVLIILANAWVFLLEIQGGDFFVTRWAVIPASITSGHAWITLLTAMFMHGSWLHILGNMIFLWAFGPAIEDAMGPVRYLLFYLLGGVIAMLAQVAGSPASTIPCIGASGAIAAVMGAFIMMFPRDRIRSFVWIIVFVSIARIPAALLIGVWFIIQLLDAGALANDQTGGVAYLAHIGGFLFGVATARLWVRRRTYPT